MDSALLERLQTGVLIQAIRVLGAKAAIIGGLATVQRVAACDALVFLSSQGTEAVLHPHVVIKDVNNGIASQTNDRVERFLIGELESVQGIPDSCQALWLNLLNRHKIPDLSYICRLRKELLVKAARTEIHLRIILCQRPIASLHRRTCICVHSFRYYCPTKKTHYSCSPETKKLATLE